MKNLNTLLSVLAIGLLIFSSCERSTICIKGNNRSTTKTIDMDAFNGVELAGSFNAEITQGDNYSLKITGDENIIDRLENDINNGICKLELQRGCYKNFKLIVDVTVPNLEYITLSGSGNMMVNNFDNQTNLTSRIDGSGNITLNKFEGTENMIFEIAGSGNIKGNRTNKTNYLETSISGSGNFDGYSISANYVSANISGSGDIKTTALTELDAVIEGSGTIRYKGYPTVYQKITGSGRIVEAN